MSAKQILFRGDARAKLLAGINTLTDAVRGTLGPKARTVVLERDFGTPLIINSASWSRGRSSSRTRSKTSAPNCTRGRQPSSDVAGDGTTTATLLAHGIAIEGMNTSSQV
jgi:chaperonin GroEL